MNRYLTDLAHHVARTGRIATVPAFRSLRYRCRSEGEVSRLVSYHSPQLGPLRRPDSLLTRPQLTRISVMSYSTATGCLELGHLHPPGSQVTASVDIRLVLELVNPELTRVGEWVNILGYKTAQQSGPAQGAADAITIWVQALRAWSTGPLDLARYEKEVQREK